jgi:hypothetical protein
MSVSLPARLRVLGPVVLAGLLMGGATTTFAQSVASPPRASCDAPVLDLANPSAGDMLIPGGYAIQGKAFDPRALQDSGIDRVSIFLDSREAGGVDLGQAAPGAPNPALEMPGFPTSADGFTLIVSLPNEIGEHTLVAYAHSSLTGRETAVSVPIVLGEDPVKAGVLAGSTSESNTNPGANPGACASPGAAAAPPSTAVGPATTPAPAVPMTTPMVNAEPLTLQLANPSPGDTLHSGANIISGTAFDSRAQQGSGIDRISIFLDSRDQGGAELTQVAVAQPSPNQFSVTVTLPSTHFGGHSLVAYAHSAVSDTETSMSVPIDLER